MKKDDPPNWSELGFVKKVGTGFQTSFWEDPWLGRTLFKVIFPCLFSISQVQKETVSEVGRWVDERLVWDLMWRKSFFIREEPLEVDLKSF